MTAPPLLIALVLLFAAACSDPASDQHRDEQGETEHHDRHDEGDDIVELQPQAAARVTIRTAPVEKQPLQAVLSTTGRVDFDQDRLAHVSPRIPGRVHEARAALGQKVEAGDVLLVVDSIELGESKSAYLQARAQLELTEQTLRREEGLLADKITTAQAVLEARAAYKQSLAAFQVARERLRLLGLADAEIEAVHYDDPAAPLFSLRAPIGGTIVEKEATLGEMLVPEHSPYVIGDLSVVWIWVDIYERDLAKVHLDDGVEVYVTAHPNRAFHGTVTYIRANVDPESRTARGRITVENPEGLLKPGMFASVTVTDPHGAAGTPAADAVVVPATAVQRDGEDSIAFVRLAENRYERRMLALGRRTETMVEVLEGVSPGEDVVVEGAFLLKSEAAKEHMGGGHGH
jgi:cobalt-zinc-cadmium efflux system membrane fusion protein